MNTRKAFLLLGLIALVGAAITGCLNPTGERPQALFTASISEQVVPFTTSFDGTLSYAPGGEIVSYLWTFGDGSTESGPIVDHTYQQDGVYEVRLTVFNAKGLSTSTNLTVRALNPPPTAGFSYSPRSNMEGDYFVSCSEDIIFDATDYCEDDGEIVKYEWYFGFRDANGDAAEATAEGPVVTQRFLWAGTYQIVLTVTDDDGGQTVYVESLDVKGGTPCNADITGDIPWNYDGSFNSGGGTCK